MTRPQAESPCRSARSAGPGRESPTRYHQHQSRKDATGRPISRVSITPSIGMAAAFEPLTSAASTAEATDVLGGGTTAGLGIGRCVVCTLSATQARLHLEPSDPQGHAGSFFGHGGIAPLAGPAGSRVAQPIRDLDEFATGSRSRGREFGRFAEERRPGSAPHARLAAVHQGPRIPCHPAGSTVYDVDLEPAPVPVTRTDDGTVMLRGGAPAFGVQGSFAATAGARLRQ